MSCLSSWHCCKCIRGHQYYRLILFFSLYLLQMCKYKQRVSSKNVRPWKQIFCCRAYVEFLEYIKVHLAAARSSIAHRSPISAESAIYLNANLDAIYYDLLQFHVRSSGCGISISIPPPHLYFPAIVSCDPGPISTLVSLLLISISCNTSSNLYTQ